MKNVAVYILLFVFGVFTYLYITNPRIETIQVNIIPEEIKILMESKPDTFYLKEYVYTKADPETITIVIEKDKPIEIPEAPLFEFKKTFYSEQHGIKVKSDVSAFSASQVSLLRNEITINQDLTEVNKIIQGQIKREKKSAKRDGILLGAGIASALIIGISLLN